MISIILEPSNYLDMSKILLIVLCLISMKVEFIEIYNSNDIYLRHLSPPGCSNLAQTPIRKPRCYITPSLILYTYHTYEHADDESCYSWPAFTSTWLFYIFTQKLLSLAIAGTPNYRRTALSVELRVVMM